VGGTDRFVSTGGLRFAVREFGDGADSALVFLHGSFVTAMTYDVMCEGIADSAGRRVLAIDQRGHGRSSHTDDYRWERWVEDIGAVADVLEVERFDLVGHSRGAFNAARFAGRHPDRVSALVLIDGGFPFETPDNEDYWGRVMSLFRDDGWRDLDEYLGVLTATFPRTDAEVIRAQWHWYEKAEDGRFHWPYAFDPALLTSASDPTDHEERSLRGATTCPVMVAKGEFSELAPGDGYLAAAADYPNAEAAVLGGAGHNVCFENVAGTVAVIADFLSHRS
jgi:pimeloyl-ACP methyl ester carboxylesterase